MNLVIDERSTIIDIVNAIGIYADRRDFEKLEKLFADEVYVDYTSLNGGTPARVKNTELIEAWKKILPGFAATQHLITNHQVTLRYTSAECLSSVCATHYLPDPAGKDTWTIMGFYEHQLSKSTFTGWKVDSLKLTVTMSLGNPELLKKAQEKSFER
ncbi:MAG: nuclear transport factor 2 family protein [Candidatus Wallbacteria bacterium]|nr:nuclear transport factor 2 family protein [Candidatus Wallbacteria bacterium]